MKLGTGEYSNPTEQEFSLRSYFIASVNVVAPQVLKTLREDVLPIYKQDNPENKRLRLDHNPNAHSSRKSKPLSWAEKKEQQKVYPYGHPIYNNPIISYDMLRGQSFYGETTWNYDIAPSGYSSLKKALIKWAKTYGLESAGEWIYNCALYSLGQSVRGHSGELELCKALLDNRTKKDMELEDMEREVHTILSAMHQLDTQGMLLMPNDIVLAHLKELYLHEKFTFTWEPFFQSRVDAMAEIEVKVKEYLDRVEAIAEKKEWKKIAEKYNDKHENEKATRHLDWLVEFQINGVEKRDLASKYKVGVGSVKSAIFKTAKSIGITLRPGIPGRPRKNS